MFLLSFFCRGLGSSLQRCVQFSRHSQRWRVTGACHCFTTLRNRQLADVAMV